jgi:hypothetical protein
MANLPIINPMLTMRFDDGEVVTLQYHPKVLDMEQKSFAHNVPGLSNTITFIPEARTSDSSISVSSYLTALLPSKDSTGLKTSLTGVAVSTVLTGLSASKTLMDFVESTFGTISLTKGVYDSISGLIHPVKLNPNPSGLARDQFEKIKQLTLAMENGIPCKINWDVVNDIDSNRKYLITQIALSTESIRESDGDSLILKLDLTMIKYGVGVRVI